MDLSPHPSLATLRPRVAILIDGDNIPRADLGKIEGAGTRLGHIALRRVFADIAQRKDWAVEGDYLITHCSTKNGKNRADMHMTVAAMDIAHRGLATGFVIASDDSDFGPLIAHLTELGFVAQRVRKTEKPKPPPRPSPLSVEAERVHQLITQSADKKLPIAALNSAMRGFHVGQTPEKTWRAWLVAKGFACDPKGPQACVRLSPHSAP